MTANSHRAVLSKLQDKLKNFSSFFQFHHDYYPDPAKDSTIRSVRWPIPSQILEETKHLSRELAVNPRSLFLAAWCLLLGRYSQQQDLTIGVNIGGKAAPLRYQLPLGLTFTLASIDLDIEYSFVMKLKHINISDLDKIISPNSKGASPPFFSVVFNELDKSYLPSMEQVEMELQVTEQMLYLNYDANLFSEQTALELLESYITLLEAGIQNPTLPYEQLKLISSRQRDQLLYKWATGPRVERPERIFLQDFETQVKVTPQRTAIVFEKQAISYEELNVLANSLAHSLINAGILPETIVAVYVNRSLCLPIALLAIMKTGGIALPIDPLLPPDRINFMLEDAKAKLMLVDSTLAPAAAQFGVKQQIIDLEQLQQFAYPTKNVELKIAPRQGVYILYTSGSTGKPKGVITEHRSLYNVLQAMQNFTPLNPLDRLLHLSSCGFDVSVMGFWWPLMQGASVVIAGGDTLGDMLGLSKLILNERCTVLNITPYVLGLLLNQSELVLNSPLRLIHVGGEEFNQEKYAKALKLKNCTVVNCYGPTECTIYSTAFLIDNSLNAPSAPIGRPLENYTCYVLDASLEPVPMGMPGELYIGGPGLARGYLNRPEITREKFIKNPFSHHSDDLLYKTGDLVYWRSDGILVFLERTDFQVKVRGHRIELGEIEHSLMQLNPIKESVVQALKLKTGKQLVGYVTFKKKSLSENEMKNFLRKKLPSYMVPIHILALEKMPVNVNGKIDRKALPLPDLSQYLANFVPPRDNLEKAIAKTWQEILQIEQVGIYDNFFELGGDSLLTAELAYKLKDSLNHEIPLHNFFTYPTIASLAESSDANIWLVDIANTVQNDIQNSLSLIPSSGPLPSARLPRAILLTGASGFLGAYLLAELLKTSQAKIYCLIREHNQEDAKQRLLANMKEYQLDITSYQNRIYTLCGDLEEPGLGLDPTTYQQLAEEVDAIYYCGAKVHHLYDYNALRPSNVLGTVELLKLGTIHHPKRHFYISTLSTSYPTDAGTLSENFSEVFPKGLELGYNISKWTSEKILQKAMERGFAVTIFRPGQIIANLIAQQTMPFSKFQLTLLLKGCLQLGQAPLGMGTLPLISVHTTAQAIAALSFEEKNMGKVFNVVLPHQHSLDEIFLGLKNASLRPLELIPFEEWKEKALPKMGGDNAFYSFKSSYQQIQASKIAQINIPAEATNFFQAAKKAHLSLDPIENEMWVAYLKKYADWFID